MLTGKQKRYLRSLANPLDAIFQIGKGGVSSKQADGIEQALEARELIKISVLKNCLDEKEEIAAQLAEQVGAEVVQIIGSTIVLYKESAEKKREDKKRIVLPE